MARLLIQANAAAAERWQIQEQTRLKQEEEARRLAAKEEKAQKAKQRQLEMKRQAAELKAKFRAEAEAEEVRFQQKCKLATCLFCVQHLHTNHTMGWLTGGSDAEGYSETSAGEGN